MSSLGEIYSAVMQQLRGGSWDVIIGYDASKHSAGAGLIAVSVTGYEDLHNSGKTDCEVTLTVSGHTDADADASGGTCRAILVYIESKLHAADWLGDVQGLSGIVHAGVAFESDGETHTAAVTYRLYIQDFNF